MSFLFYQTNTHTHTFFFIIQRVKARAIPCPHQPPTRGDNTVSVAQGGTATPGATQQLLPPDRVLRELYIHIYTSDQLRVCDLKNKKKNAFTFGGWCYYTFTVTVFYVITRERWFRVYFLHAENFSLSTKSTHTHTHICMYVYNNKFVSIITNLSFYHHIRFTKIDHFSIYVYI